MFVVDHLSLLLYCLCIHIKIPDTSCSMTGRWNRRERGGQLQVSGKREKSNAWNVELGEAGGPFDALVLHDVSYSCYIRGSVFGRKSCSVSP